MAAVALKSRELELTKEESHGLASASANVAQHYGIVPSEKTQAWCALIMIVGMTYYPRAMMIRARLAEDKAARVNEAVAARTQHGMA